MSLTASGVIREGLRLPESRVEVKVVGEPRPQALPDRRRRLRARRSISISAAARLPLNRAVQGQVRESANRPQFRLRAACFQGIMSERVFMADDWPNSWDPRSRIPHPDSPAGRTFDWSSIAVPHPDSPSGKVFDWLSRGLPHPGSPAAQVTDWQSAVVSFEHQRRKDPAWQVEELERLAGGGSGGAASQSAAVPAPIPEVEDEPSTRKRDATRQPESLTRAAGIRTWVAFKLIDEHGDPVPDAAYRVQLPDGSVREGTLDRNGMARFDDIDPGRCRITFTEIDAKEWQFV